MTASLGVDDDIISYSLLRIVKLAQVQHDHKALFCRYVLVFEKHPSYFCSRQLPTAYLETTPLPSRCRGF